MSELARSADGNGLDTSPHGDEMPDYDYELALNNGSFVVHGKVGDAQVRKIASGAPSFPPDFTTRIALARPVRGFRHRYRDKTLEVVLVR